jgi:hypothetical protein
MKKLWYIVLICDFLSLQASDKTSATNFLLNLCNKTSITQDELNKAENILSQYPKLAQSSINSNNDTFLHLTTNPDFARLLIKNKAIVNAKNNDGNTPLNLVKNLDIAKLLIDNKANVDNLNNIGKIPVQTVSDLDIKRMLIIAGSSLGLGFGDPTLNFLPDFEHERHYLDEVRNPLALYYPETLLAETLKHIYEDYLKTEDSQLLEEILLDTKSKSSPPLLQNKLKQYFKDSFISELRRLKYIRNTSNDVPDKKVPEIL